jgi:hypothetical protein
MFKKYFFIFICLMFCSHVYAQNALLKGILIDEEHNTIITKGNIQLQGTHYQAPVDANGYFEIKDIPYGNYTLQIQANSFIDYSKDVIINKPSVDLGNVALQHANPQETTQDIPVVTLTESDLKDNGSQNVASSLTASRDAFLSAITFSFSVARFQARGYDNENVPTYMNGAPMQDLTSGRTQFFTWTGLNDVMRGRENTYGLAAGTYAFGGVGGSFLIDSRASHQRKQFQVSFAKGNRSYDNRLMATYGSGLLKGGWSVAATFSRRWADEGYVKGTFYDGTSYFLSVEKIINNKHFISLTGFGAPVTNGRTSPAIQEMLDLAGTNYYNPNWGYQNGKVRNVSVAQNHLPTAILSWEWKLTPTSSLMTAVSTVNGKSKVSAFDWFNATDPRADFYRRLPSFIEDSATAAQVAQLLRDNEAERQIKWDELYQTNYNSTATIYNANGIAGNNVTGLRSRYIVEDRVTKINKINFNTYYNNILSEKTTLTAGLTHQRQNSQFYKEVNDLLGGDFYVDYNQFAEQDYPGNNDALQNDLNNPNRILKEGDKFGYDYVAHVNRTNAWIQPQFKLNQVDFFIGVDFSHTAFYREGKVRNGIFSENSFGNSEKQSFTNAAIKGGATYKINGRNYLFANVATLTRAPLFENAFVSARTRNSIIDNLTDEKITSVEGGYLLKAPKLKARVVGYYTKFNDGVNVMSFYHDDFRTFVNYSLTDIDKVNTGMELSVDANLGKGFSVVAVASVGQNRYTSRPFGTLTQDNSDTILASETIYLKNFKVGGTQAAYMLGISYRSPKFWFVSLNVNYFDRIFVEANPARRTQAAVDLVDPDSQNWSNIIDQQQLDGQLTVDFFGGYSYKLNNSFKNLKRQSFIVLNIGINNLLNNTDFRTNGFEQLRFDFNDKNPEKFPAKYFYSFGTTFFANLTLRFN